MAECGKKDTCKNYEKKCSECWAKFWANPSLYDTHPCYTSKDLVEVVRCKDCGAYLEYSHCEYMGLNGFCSLGFRTPKERGGEK